MPKRFSLSSTYALRQRLLDHVNEASRRRVVHWQRILLLWDEEELNGAVTELCALAKQSTSASSAKPATSATMVKSFVT
eukprot:6183749-Pleurochrysis_carterae.AAC.1